MREDIRLLGTILGDTVREQNGERGVRPRRTRPGRIVSGAALGDRPRRASRDVRRYRHPRSPSGDPGVQPLRAAGQRRRRHPPGTAPRNPRPGRRATPEQQPGRHLLEARCSTTGFGHRRRRAQRRAGVTGDHSAPHRDPTPHRLRHPAPDHRADAAAAARVQRNSRRPRHRNRAAPPDFDALADRADPIAAVEDSRRDRSRACGTTTRRSSR